MKYVHSHLFIILFLVINLTGCVNTVSVKSSLNYPGPSTIADLSRFEAGSGPMDLTYSILGENHAYSDNNLRLFTTHIEKAFDSTGAFDSIKYLKHYNTKERSNLHIAFEIKNHWKKGGEDTLSFKIFASFMWLSIDLPTLGLIPMGTETLLNIGGDYDTEYIVTIFKNGNEVKKFSQYYKVGNAIFLGWYFYGGMTDAQMNFTMHQHLISNATAIVMKHEQSTNSP